MARRRRYLVLAALAVVLVGLVALTGGSRRTVILDSVLALGMMWVLGTAVAKTAPSAERLIAGLLGLLGAAWLVMAQPVVGVSLVGHPLIVRPVLIGLVAGLGWWRRREIASITCDPLPLLTGVAAAALVAAPELARPADNYGGDMLWHEGWLRQVASGALEPTGLYSGVPNAYPWMYHALGAGLMRVGDAGMASTLLMLEALMLLALGLGVWLLAVELGLDRVAGTWAILFALAGAGFGWVGQVTTGGFDGESLLAPPAIPSIYAISPALPRDWGLALVPAALWLMVRGARTSNVTALAVSGATAGFAFLMSPPSGVVTLAIIVVTGLALRSIRTALVPVAAAAAVTSMWLLPLAWHYHELGGFVRLSDIHPPGLSVGHAILDLGITLPLGLGGLLLARSRLDPVSRRALMCIVVASAAVWAVASQVPAGIRFRIPQFESEIRYLPTVVLALACPAGLAAATLVRAVRRRLAPAAAIAIALVSVAATVGAVVYQAQQDAARRPIQRLGFACVPRVAIRPPQTIADVGLSRWVALSAFSATGSFTLFTRTPRIRYRGPLPDSESQGQRRRALQEIAAGGRPPAQVAWVLSRSTRRLQNPFLKRVAVCQTVSSTLALYRVAD